MLFGGFFGGLTGKRKRTQTVHRLAAALNTLDYDIVRTLVTPDIKIRDAANRSIEGADAFIAADRRFREDTHRPQVRFDQITEHDDWLLVSGKLESALPELDGPVLLRIRFEGSQMAEIEITRAEPQLSVTKYDRMIRR
ncbi:nuclear transport factor 2 family protein [Qipengyuania sp. RANM35]|uniref:nuclear transport factor 2 family protein n=1 Tax=Qipengyuania sp. RANM35 TaxID=3068635 RepID=UPI0034DB0BE0